MFELNDIAMEYVFCSLWELVVEREDSMKRIAVANLIRRLQFHLRFAHKIRASLFLAVHILICALHFSSRILSHSLQFFFWKEKRSNFCLQVSSSQLTMELSLRVKSECKSDYSVDMGTHRKRRRVYNIRIKFSVEMVTRVSFQVYYAIPVWVSKWMPKKSIADISN